MKIFIPTPSFQPHGGVRVICEWANQLSRRGHKVLIYSLKKDKCNWFTFDNEVVVAEDDKELRNCDVLIITSPHSIHYQDRVDRPKKIFVFVQMLEHLFNPKDRNWFLLCKKFYTSSHPTFVISSWNKHIMLTHFKASQKIHYIGNGVNTEMFPFESKKKENIILVEGFQPINISKDKDMISAKVCEVLKKRNYKIISYGMSEPTKKRSLIDKFFVKPDLKTLNQIYNDSKIMIKSSIYDARSCAPMEAMTKSTVTVRAIEYGDDDLIHEFNCLRCDYNEDHLLNNVERLLEDEELRNQIAYNGVEYLKEFSWSFWFDRINKIITE